jgi:hypothetical protein
MNPVVLGLVNVEARALDRLYRFIFLEISCLGTLYIPEDYNFYNYCCEKFASYNALAHYNANFSKQTRFGYSLIFCR